MSSWRRCSKYKTGGPIPEMTFVSVHYSKSPSRMTRGMSSNLMRGCNGYFIPIREVLNPARWDGVMHKPGTFLPFGGESRLCPSNYLTEMEISVVFSPLKWLHLFA